MKSIKIKKVPLSKGIHLLPSLFTTGNMYFGYYSIIRSIAGDYERAAWAIFIASIFDMVDGRLARMTKTQSDFGREYDSLVDLVSFGLAPAILLYTWSLMAFRPVGWVLTFLYFACVALRLARYNIQIDTIEKKRFQGLPSPAAACMIASFILFHQSFGGIFSWLRGYFTLALAPVLAILMVSNVRYRSFKEYDLKKTNTFYFLIGAAVCLGLIAIHPAIVLFITLLAYCMSGPLGEIVFFRRRRIEKGIARSGRVTRSQHGRRIAIVNPLETGDNRE